MSARTHRKYFFVHPESPYGKLYRQDGVDGDGLSDYTLVGVTPAGLYVLRKLSWVERLFRIG